MRRQAAGLGGDGKTRVLRERLTDAAPPAPAGADTGERREVA